MDAFRKWLKSTNKKDELQLFDELSQGSVGQYTLDEHGYYIPSQSTTPTYKQISDSVGRTFKKLSAVFNNRRASMEEKQLATEQLTYYDRLWKAMSLWETSPKNISVSPKDLNPFKFGSTKSVNTDIRYLMRL